MVVHCCVNLCKSRFKKNSDISYHEFPKDNDMRLKWLKAVSRKDFNTRINTEIPKDANMHHFIDVFLIDINMYITMVPIMED